MDKYEAFRKGYVERIRWQQVGANGIDIRYLPVAEEQPDSNDKALRCWYDPKIDAFIEWKHPRMKR